MSKHRHSHEHKNEHECGQCHPCSKLKPLPLALAGGFLCALGTLSLGWSAALSQWGTGMVQTLASVYLGFQPTLAGGLYGAAWGFLDGFFSGLIFAFLYNAFLCCCLCKKSCSKEGCNTKHHH